jgi:hypothetical protein
MVAPPRPVSSGVPGRWPESVDRGVAARGSRSPRSAGRPRRRCTAPGSLDNSSSCAAAAAAARLEVCSLQVSIEAGETGEAVEAHSLRGCHTGPYRYRAQGRTRRSAAECRSGRLAAVEESQGHVCSALVSGHRRSPPGLTLNGMVRPSSDRIRGLDFPPCVSGGHPARKRVAPRKNWALNRGANLSAACSRWSPCRVERASHPMPGQVLRGERRDEPSSALSSRRVAPRRHARLRWRSLPAAMTGRPAPAAVVPWAAAGANSGRRSVRRRAPGAPAADGAAPARRSPACR